MGDIDLSQDSAARGGSQPLGGYLARPTGAGPWPGVVLIHEVFGLDEQTRRHTDHLATLGYLALAVDLYSQGGARRCLVSTMRALRRGAGRPLIDIVTAQTHLRADPDCSGRVGVIGFCMGGGFALLSAPAAFDVASVNYGQVPDDADGALVGACPVVGSYGGRDPSLRGAAAKLSAALGRAGVEHDIEEYPEASHAFLNDAVVGPIWMRPLLRRTGFGPQPEAAADAWRRIDTFFSAHLRPST